MRSVQQWLSANHGASYVSTSNDGATDIGCADHHGATATNNACADVTSANDRARAASVHSRWRFPIRFWRLLHIWRWWLQPRFLLFRHRFYNRAARDSGV